MATAHFNAEGRKILAAPSGRYNDMDIIWRHPKNETGAIYVGNESAAYGPEDKLLAKGITHVVNCTDDMPNFCERQITHPPHPTAHLPRLKYLRWNVAYWQSAGNMKLEQPATSKMIADFVGTLLDFVEDAVDNGGSVLVHCLAGAHRAGTTGCLLLMHFLSLSAADAIKEAKRLRPVINPIGSLPLLLSSFEGRGHNSRG